MNNDVLLAAIDYLKLGFSIIPVQPRGKKPEAHILPPKANGYGGWEVYQERPPLVDEARIWFENRPALNIGIICGKISGIVVVDIDGVDGARSFKEVVGKDPCYTVWASTGSGFHGYFKYPRNVTIGNRVGVLPGLDIRSDGGFVVAPPSIHSNGKLYDWNKKFPQRSAMAELPSKLLELLTAEDRAKGERQRHFRVDATGDYARNAERIFNYQCHCLQNAPSGERNNQLNFSTFALARIVKTGALSEGNVKDAMHSIALSVGLSEKEIDATIESAFNAGISDPRAWTWGK